MNTTDNKSQTYLSDQDFFDELRVSDRSGTPQAGDPAEEYSGERDPRRIWPRGTPPSNTREFEGIGAQPSPTSI